MNKQFILSLAATSILIGSAGAAYAQAADPIVPGHPRVSEVDQRLQNQQQRIDAGVNGGKMSTKQAVKDEKRDTKISQQLSKDEAKNGGHITAAEDKHLNKELNQNSKTITKQQKNYEKQAETVGVHPNP